MRKIFMLLVVTAYSVIARAQLLGPPDTDRIRITDSIECTSVKDQGQSPTCWVFGTNSIFESDMIKQFNTRLNLSEMFIARYAYIDKAARYLATGGKTYFEGGGQFHDVIRVVNKYGMVPEEVYNGKPNEQYSHNHSRLDTAMKYCVLGMLRNGRTSLDNDDLRRLNDTLDRYLGKVPLSFTWKGKQFTPLTFAKEILHFENDYAELVSFSDKPLYKQFILEDKYNWANDSFWNISLADMQMVVDTALQKGWSVGWEGDVTETGFNYFEGYAALADSAWLYDEQRLENYRTEATERDHMLQVTGAGFDEHGKKWYRLKNSWGTWLSKYKGFLYMEENYFRMKTVILFVNKKGLPESLKQKLGM